MDEDTAAAERAQAEVGPDRRRRAVRVGMGVVGILAACAATVAVTLSQSRGWADVANGHRIDVVRVSEGPLPPGFAASPGARTGTFRGLALVAVPDGDRWCLYVARRDDLVAESDAVAGPVTSTCGAGPFAATVVIALSAAPDTLRARYPGSDALSFTLRGNEVEVRAD